MTFNIDALYQEIQARKAEVGRLSLIEFDDSVNKWLLVCARLIIRHYERWRHEKQAKARIVFLAFAMEYVRHTNYIQNDNKFWEEFDEMLGLGEHKYRNLIYEIFELAFEEENIKLERKTNRLFVQTLLTEVNEAKSTRSAFVDFFCWYYQYYRPLKNTSEVEITSQLLQYYIAKEKKPLSLHPKAILTLNDDCQNLANIIDYAVENDLFLAHSDPATYQEELIRASSEYDLSRIRLIRNKNTIYNLIIKLENHRTPAQFLKELEHHRRSSVVLLPVGKRPASSVNEVLRYWKASDMIYGSYMVGSTNYRVVSFPWLRLEVIAQWPLEKVMKLHREGYIAYKKAKTFEVKISRQSINARRCIFENGKECYIWADKVPRGELLVIDGHLCKETVGVDWGTSLELSHNEDGDPDIMLVFDWLRAFYPDNRGQRLIIGTSQEHEKITYLDHEQGISNLSRAISFHLERLDTPVIISMALEQNPLQNKTIEAEKAYLFSAVTQKRILDGTKREWGEQRYVLFADHHEVLETGEGVSLAEYETSFGNYAVYDVKWDKRHFPFQLRVGDVSWDFEKQRYFYIQVSQLQSKGPVRLARQQIHRFTQAQIQIWTNRELTENKSITCHLLYQGNEKAVLMGFQKHGEDLYVLNEATIKRLNFLTTNQHCYGQFDLLFYECENEQEDGQLLGQTSVTLIPEVLVSLPSLYAERQVSPVRISSQYLRIWDTKTSRPVNSADFPIAPKLSGQPWKNEEQVPEGIRCLCPQAVRIPVTFPAISETVEVEVCPSIFGFRLYQRQRHQSGHQQVSQLDYYALKASVLYVHTVPLGSVAIHVNRTNVRVDSADEDGYLLIKNLHFLKKHCKEERTAITIVSERLESTFFVCWTPFIHDLNVKENRIEFSGPQNTGITLRLVDAWNNIRCQQSITCDAGHSKDYLDLPEIEAGWDQCYLIPYYRLADGKLLPTVWQQRLEASSINHISRDWLRSGIGISSEMLLQYGIAE